MMPTKHRRSTEYGKMDFFSPDIACYIRSNSLPKVMKCLCKNCLYSEFEKVFVCLYVEILEILFLPSANLLKLLNVFMQRYCVSYN